MVHGGGVCAKGVICDDGVFCCKLGLHWTTDYAIMHDE